MEETLAMLAMLYVIGVGGVMIYMALIAVEPVIREWIWRRNLRVYHIDIPPRAADGDVEVRADIPGGNPAAPSTGVVTGAAATAVASGGTNGGRPTDNEAGRTTTK